MYNEERKEQFLRTISTSEQRDSASRAVFQAVAPNELQAEIDIAEFSAEQLTTALRKFRLTKLSAAAVRLRFFRKYQAWCQEHGFSTTLSALRIKPADICRTASFMVSSPGDLQRSLDQSLSDESEMSVDTLLRLYCWCAFAGIPEKELPEILTSDISIETATIRSGQKYYRIEWLGQDALRKCVCETKMRSSFYNADGKPQFRKRADNDFLFRSMRSKVLRPKDLQAYYTERELNIPTYYAAQTSGIFYRVFAETADPEKKEIDFDGSGYQLYMALTDGASKWKPGERERQLIFKREYLQWLQTFYGR
jgi:hypothetical protein